MYGLHRDILLSMLVHVLWRTSHGIMSNNIYNLTHEIDSMFVFFLNLMVISLNESKNKKLNMEYFSATKKKNK